MNEEMDQEARLEALDFTARAVSATLSIMAQAGTLDHVDTSAALHMLSQVLDHPEVMV